MMSDYALFPQSEQEWILELLGKNAISGKTAENTSKLLEIFLKPYAPIIVFMGIALGLSLMILLLARLRGVYRPDPEKLSPYECGFEPFSDARIKFDIRFYLVAILFIIFDLEIAFLFPWALIFKKIGWFGFASMMFFLTILTVGFIYEWKKGALEWE